MKLSLCIPSYNRPDELKRLLESTLFQKGNFNIVIAEDNSPRRNEIVQVVDEFIKKYKDANIQLVLNKENFGYDRNLRNLIELSDCDYCMFLGDDDILLPGAVEKVCNVVEEFNDIGFILRSWKERDLQGVDTVQQRYFPGDKLFEPGVDTIVKFYRKSVFISGLVVDRREALKYSTNLVDGKLLYQLYLLGNILAQKRGYYIYDYLVLRINGADHFFGSSNAEKSSYTPQKLFVENSLNFMYGFIEIIDYLQITNKDKLKQKIIHDLSKYSFGFLTFHREKGFNDFLRYVKGLRNIGYGSSYYFYFYVIFISLVGKKSSLRFVALIKRILPSTPQL